MPLIRRNYRDLTPAQRREGAKIVRERLRVALSAPGLGPEQVRYLQDQLSKIDCWEAGSEISSSASQDVASAMANLGQKLCPSG